MYIQIEETPNPHALKFFPGCVVLNGVGTLDISSEKDAEVSQIAKDIFSIPNVSRVFFARDFISVTKSDAADWSIVKVEILTIISEFFSGGGRINLDDEDDADENDSEVVKTIKELINQQVRPAVQQDGGDIKFNSFSGGILYLKLQGACSGCPSSTYTLKEGIENMMKYYVPEVKSVEAIPE